MRKILSAVAALLFVVGFAATATATAPADARVVTSAHRAFLEPLEGHYEGVDQGHRVVTFTYSRAHGITNFRVGHHHAFPDASVSGNRWHHTCHGGHCTQGHWRQNDYVVGHWNNYHESSRDLEFEAMHVG